MHLFLNFCVSNGVDSCPQGPDTYVSLRLAIRTWQAAAHVTEAPGGRAWLQLFDGRVHEARAQPDRPLPLDLLITERAVAGGGVSYGGRLRMSLPRVDAAGEPLLITADIN
jgi:hypothetical protein